MSKTFSVGDRVTWKSQAAGSWKTKTGTVVEVVPSFKVPRDRNFGSNRHHESYIVEVTFEPKRSTSAIKSVRVKKPERYWPRTSNLRLVKRGSTSTTKAASSGHAYDTAGEEPDGRFSSSNDQVKRDIAMKGYDGPPPVFEDLKTDHLPIQVLEGDKDLLWKDVQDAERAIANAESTN